MTLDKAVRNFELLAQRLREEKVALNIAVFQTDFENAVTELQEQVLELTSPIQQEADKKVIQISAMGTWEHRWLTVLCEDGSIFWTDNGVSWTPVPLNFQTVKTHV